MSFDGKLWPCCYFNDIYKSKGTINNEDHIYEMRSFDKLKELDKKFGLNWNSVLHHSWEEILKADKIRKEQISEMLKVRYLLPLSIAKSLSLKQSTPNLTGRLTKLAFWDTQTE